MIDQSTNYWWLLLSIFVKITIFLRAIAPWHCCEPPSARQEQWRRPCSLSWITDRWEAVVHIHKEATGNVAAGVCSCAKVAARETGRSCSTPPPPYCRWWLLVKLTPNMTARLMRRGCHGFECGASSRTSCQPRFQLAIIQCCSVVDVEDMVFGDGFDDRVHAGGGVAWFGGRSGVSCSVSSSSGRLTVSSGRLCCRNSPLATFSTARLGEERGRALWTGSWGPTILSTRW